MSERSPAQRTNWKVVSAKVQIKHGVKSSDSFFIEDNSPRYQIEQHCLQLIIEEIPVDWLWAHSLMPCKEVFMKKV